MDYHHNAANQGDKGSMYSIGQKLRIRVGPLKGYLCRVIALRYSDITVKLDSQHKIFTGLFSCVYTVDSILSALLLNIFNGVFQLKVSILLRFGTEILCQVRGNFL